MPPGAAPMAANAGPLTKHQQLACTAVAALVRAQGSRLAKVRERGHHAIAELPTSLDLDLRAPIALWRPGCRGFPSCIWYRRPGLRPCFDWQTRLERRRRSDAHGGLLSREAPGLRRTFCIGCWRSAGGRIPQHFPNTPRQLLAAPQDLGDLFGANG